MALGEAIKSYYLKRGNDGFYCSLIPPIPLRMMKNRGSTEIDNQQMEYLNREYGNGIDITL